MANKTIAELTEISEIENGDWLPVYDTSITSTRKINASSINTANKYCANILDFDGIDRTGNNDNTSILQTAINQALSYKAALYIPSGQYATSHLYTYYDANKNPNAPNDINSDLHIKIYGDQNLGFKAALSEEYGLGSNLIFTESTGNCLNINDGTLNRSGGTILSNFSIIGNTNGRLLSIERPGANVNLSRLTISNRRTTSDSTVKTIESITRSESVALVVLVGHGYNVGDSIIIEGANEDSYNGCHEILSADTNTFTFRITNTTASSATTDSIITARKSNGVALFLRDVFLIRARDLQVYGHNSYNIGYGILQEAHHSHGSGLGSFEQCTTQYFDTAAQFGKQWTNISHHTHAFLIDSSQFSFANYGLVLRHGCSNYMLFNPWIEGCNVAGLLIKDSCEKVIIEGGDNSCNVTTKGQLVTGVGGHLGISAVVSNGATARLSFPTDHGLSNNDKISVLGYKPGAYTNLNGDHTITVIDNNTISIPVDISGDGGVGIGGMIIGWKLASQAIDPRKENKTGDIIINNYFSRWVGNTTDAIRRYVARDNGILKIENSYIIGDSEGAGEGIVFEDNIDPKIYCNNISWTPTGFGVEISDSSKFVVINNTNGNHADGMHMLTEAELVGHAIPTLGVGRDWSDSDSIPLIFKSNGNLTHYLPKNPKLGTQFTIINNDGNNIILNGNGKNISYPANSTSTYTIGTIRTAYTFKYDGSVWRLIGQVT